MPLPLLPLLAGAAALFLATRKGTTVQRTDGAPGSAPGSTPGSMPAGCEGVPPLPPPSGGSTDFDALPNTPLADLGGQSLRDFYYESMKLTPDTILKVNQEAAAVGCESKARILRCNGYKAAADKLMQQAIEIRQWKL